MLYGRNAKIAALTLLLVRNFGSIDDCALSCLHLVHLVHSPLRIICSLWALNNGLGKSVQSSVTQILLKFGMCVHYISGEAAQWLKCTYHEIQDCRLRPNFNCLICYNSAADCPIVMKFGRIVHYGSAEVAELLNL